MSIVLRCTSVALPDNVASHRVSERVGSRLVDRSEPIVAGTPRPIDVYGVKVETWRAHRHPEVRIVVESEQAMRPAQPRGRSVSARASAATSVRNPTKRSRSSGVQSCVRARIRASTCA